MFTPACLHVNADSNRPEIYTLQMITTISQKHIVTVISKTLWYIKLLTYFFVDAILDEPMAELPVYDQHMNVRQRN